MKKFRRVIAAIFFLLITLLFLDYSGAVHKWLVWMAKIQLLPAILAHSIAIVLVILLVTLLFGRVYCSVICPMGVFQDLVARVGRRGKKNPYSYSLPKSVIRYSCLGAIIIAAIFGVSAVVSILDPYAAYGRIANNIFMPIWQFGNNILAYFAERMDSYTFHSVEIWVKSSTTLVVSLITLFAIGFLAWRGGRTYCNTVCPVGTLLGLVSKFSFFRIAIDKDKCNKCSVCARNCKASCIDYKNYSVDSSRCVSCFNCISSCRRDAINYRNIIKKHSAGVDSLSEVKASDGRREFITTVVALSAAAVAKAQTLPKQVEMKMDGGLAAIDNIKPAKRRTPITPPGSKGVSHLINHCTACQLCVTACPNGVLVPSKKLDNFMQPELSFVKGYCRPECNKCGKVCPSNAINKISLADKTATQIGHAVWAADKCIAASKGVKCNNCARKCPTQAITMVKSDRYEMEIPIINVERCIGCGACEHLCPARPYSAMHIEGHVRHRLI